MSRQTENSTKRPEIATAVQDTFNSGAINMWTMTDFVARFDEAAKRRLDTMNEKLRDMERQMEALEAEINKANDSSNAECCIQKLT